MANYYLVVGEMEERIAPREMKNHIGRRIRYLRSRDIDKSGRGYYFPREGTITGKYRSYILIDDTDESISSIKEVILLPSTPTNQ